MVPRGWIVALVVVALAAGALALGAVGGGARATRPLAVIGGQGLGPGEFQGPRALAVDAQALYVADQTGRYQKFTAEGRYLGLWEAPDKALGYSESLALTPDGRLLVADTHYSRILCYTPEGARLPARELSHAGEEPGGLVFPIAVAVNREGEIYVADYGGRDHRVLRFDAEGHFLNQVGTNGDGPVEFKRPSGLSLDREGRVYVADTCNHRVQRFTAELAYLGEWGGLGTEPGRLSFPYDLAVGPWPGGDPADPTAPQAVYVLERGNHRVQVFSLDGRSLTLFGGLGTEPGRLNSPWGIAVAPDGTVYVADTDNHRIQRFRMGHIPYFSPPPGKAEGGRMKDESGAVARPDSPSSFRKGGGA